MSEVATSFNKQAHSELSGALIHLLAETYRLYLQTKDCHLRVAGFRLHELQLIFEGQREELEKAVEEIAEHVRLIDSSAKASYKEYPTYESMLDMVVTRSTTEMVELLATGHEQVLKSAVKGLQITRKLNDDSTASLIMTRMYIHEKSALKLKTASRDLVNFN